MMHLALKKTRGAAAAISEFNREAKQITYCGVGNITTALLDKNTWQALISHNGTLGYMEPRFQEYKYNWTHNSTLVMHSDGLSTRERPEYLDETLPFDSSLIAALLFRDCKHNRDDITLLVAKEKIS